MIKSGIYDDFGKKHKYVSIDLSSKKYKNRVLNILQTSNPSIDGFEYEIQAKWTPSQYHPTMSLSEKDLIELSEKLNMLVDEIKAKADS
ncbi:hypothetical protein [Vibrio alginolyticus]|uniref:hypothetical protein n=1 Tax=Vibrio alginolyticus TaxID=663 RepID=UPI001EEF2C5A|nr:hypothetical protein [Vibrio alginolyticus]ULF83689.1 hypothetical protein K6750_06235 [Vibrio alginolyticus]